MVECNDRAFSQIMAFMPLLAPMAVHEMLPGRFPGGSQDRPLEVSPAAANAQNEFDRLQPPRPHRSVGWARLRWTPSGLQEGTPSIQWAMHLHIVRLRVL